MLELFQSSPAIAIAITLALGVGCMLFLVGYLLSLAYAFSDGLGWGFAVLLIPLFVYYYCFTHWQKAAWPGKMLVAGGLLAFPVLIFMYYDLFRQLL